MTQSDSTANQALTYNDNHQAAAPKHDQAVAQAVTGSTTPSVDISVAQDAYETDMNIASPGFHGLDSSWERT